MASMLAKITQAEPAMPERIAHYRLIARLGEGGFGAVYEGWDERLERAVAVKILRDRADAAQGQKLLKEARMSARLEHRSFVRVYDFIEADGKQAIVMELVRGRTLSALIDEGPVPVAQALELGRQAAIALDIAHGLRLVHGDIKPSNLMLEASGEVRILDFGLARRVAHANASGSTTSSLIAGTVAYMAPETLRGKPFGAAADMYSLGVVLFELLSGTRPFESTFTVALMYAVVHEEPRALHEAMGIAPSPLTALVTQMMSRDLAQRPGSMAEVCRRIDELQASNPEWAQSRVADISQSQRIRALRPRRTTLAMIGLLALLLFAAGLLVRSSADWWRRDAVTLVPTAVPTASATQDFWSAEKLLRVFDEKGSIDRAIALLDSVLQREPQHAAAAAALGMAYCLKYTSDDRDEVWLKRAQVSAELATGLDDQLALAQAAKAWVLEFQGRDADVEPAYARALILEPTNLYALYGYSRWLGKQRRYPEAMQQLDKASAAYPDERLFQDAIGTLRYQTADYAGAEQAFRRSIALKPDSVYAYANLNATLVRLGRVDEALTVLQQGLKIRPSGRLYSNLGTTLFSQARYLEAVDAFQRAISADKGSPNDYLRWSNLADALRWVPGREAEAKRAYGNALALLEPLLQRSPNDATGLSRAALYAAKLGRTERARSWLAAALKIAPDNADVRNRATVVSEILGARDAALEHLGRALALGFPKQFVESDPELIALRRDERYHFLMAGAQDSHGN